MAENNDKHEFVFEDKHITILGTAHVSRESADLVRQVIREKKPDTVAIELCDSRYQSIKNKSRWQDMDLLKVIREKKAFVLLSNLMLAAFQKKIGDKFGVRPGEEMLQAIEGAEELGAQVHLADRDIRITLARTWRLMSFWTKMKLLVHLVLSAGDVEKLEEEDVERMKKEDVLATLLSEIGQTLPEIRDILIDERDQYLTEKIRTAPGKRIVAVVGAGHVPGIKKYWQEAIDTEPLEQTPPKGKLATLLKWGLPAAIVLFIVLGFFTVGTHAGAQMIKWWILANAVLAGLGAGIALAHPLTILTAVAASPLTSINPMIAAGWVAGFVEIFLGKPKVRDFENLTDDILSVKGFWKNKITRILLVVVFTNMGSALGTFVAIPLMAQALT